MKKEVMTKAVRMAKKMQGDWIARMKMALKMAWAIIKKQATIEVKRPIEMIKEKLEEKLARPTMGTDLSGLELNIWEKYGKSRIYVNGINKGFFDFDQEGNIQKWFFDCGFNKQVEGELNAIAELMEMGEFA